MTREIGLVSCVKSKRDEPAPPRDLYTSDYFQKMRRYAEAHHDEWYVLSAEYGLLDPDGEPIEPYDKTLRDATAAEKRDWAERVNAQLEEAGIYDGEPVLVIHAGRDYYEALLPLFESRGLSVEIPTEGLGIGEKNAWYMDEL